MSQLQKLKKEIQSTLKVEKENALHYSSSISEADDIHKGWIEALEYVIREIELLDKSDDLEALKIHKKAEKLNRRINEDTGDYNFREDK